VRTWRCDGLAFVVHDEAPEWSPKSQPFHAAVVHTCQEALSLPKEAMRSCQAFLTEWRGRLTCAHARQWIQYLQRNAPVLHKYEFEQLHEHVMSRCAKLRFLSGTILEKWESQELEDRV
jgi:hypothetical protein